MSEEKFDAQGNVASINKPEHKEHEFDVGPEAIPKKKLSFSSPTTVVPLVPLHAPKVHKSVWDTDSDSDLDIDVSYLIPSATKRIVKRFESARIELLKKLPVIDMNSSSDSDSSSSSESSGYSSLESDVLSDDETKKRICGREN